MDFLREIPGGDPNAVPEHQFVRPSNGSWVKPDKLPKGRLVIHSIYVSYGGGSICPKAGHAVCGKLLNSKENKCFQLNNMPRTLRFLLILGALGCLTVTNSTTARDCPSRQAWEPAGTTRGALSRLHYLTPWVCQNSITEFCAAEKYSLYISAPSPSSLLRICFTSISESKTHVTVAPYWFLYECSLCLAMSRAFSLATSSSSALSKKKRNSPSIS